MKRLTYIATALIIGLTSCTKVIDVNFDNAPEKIVIQGKINNNQPAEIKVTQTVEADKDNVFPGVSGAVVTISDDAGHSETLQDFGNGVYRGKNLLGQSGNTYTMNVTTGGNTYSSVSTMPQLVRVDSITTRAFAGFGGGNEFAVLHYTDPATPGNFYRAILYVNDTLVPDIFIEDDKFINGNSRDAVLFSSEYELHKGDSIRVEINCIDSNVYEYLLELIDVNGASQVASPSNPTTNISGGALGYFSAQTSSMMGKRYE